MFCTAALLKTDENEFFSGYEQNITAAREETLL